MKAVLLNAFYLVCIACSLAACRPSYSCHCYLDNHPDTSAQYGGISSDEAHKRCDAMHTAKPQDSCGVEGLGYH